MLKVGMLLGCCAVIATAQVAAASAASADSSAFGGRWASTDLDGSNQSLDIRGASNGHRAMSMYDDAAGICGGAPALVSGAGTISGTTITMRAAIACLPGGNPLPGRVSVEFSYDAGTDTLVDQFGVTWHRAG